MNRAQFKEQGGGFDRINKVFDGKLEHVLEEFADEVWEMTA